MTRKAALVALSVGASAAVVAAGAAVAWAPAGADTNGGAAAHTEVTWKLQMPDRYDHDSLHGKPRAGTLDLGHGSVFRSGKRVGEDIRDCAIVTVGRTTALSACQITLSLRGQGTLALQGLLYYYESKAPSSPGMAITGGTGSFDHASGNVQLQFPRNGVTAIVHLTY